MADKEQPRVRFSREPRPQILAPCTVPHHHREPEPEPPADAPAEQATTDKAGE